MRVQMRKQVRGRGGQMRVHGHHMWLAFNCRDLRQITCIPQLSCVAGLEFPKKKELFRLQLYNIPPDPSA